ncbi:hypothetical protein HMPREF0578_1422 [Mobiluncus mulieris 28-1]|nr:hypothetical protein HMPREF0578_1422 [Mobiluncus mulieris 28-1]
MPDSGLSKVFISLAPSGYDYDGTVLESREPAGKPYRT